MGQQTEIAWTDATFNPWWGCTKVSPACDHCYAERLAKRFGVEWGVGKPRRYFGDKHWDEPLKWNARAEKARTPLRVFCASMGDVLDNEVEQVHRERLWGLQRKTPWLLWLLLTKRIGNAAKMLPADWGTGYRNVQLGITVVNQDEVDRDVPKLLATAARVRFLSVEPLLEEIDLSKWLGGISLVIVGGESGAHARPMDLDWVRSLRRQCKAAGVAFFVKQLSQADTKTFKDFASFPPDLQVREFPHAVQS